MGSNVNKKFYKTVWFCVLMLFIFAPVGIILLWKNKFFSTRINVIFSIASAMLFIVLLAIPPESNISDVDTSNSSPVSSPDSTAQTTTPMSGSNVEYDALQQLYLDLDPNMSYEDMFCESSLMVTDFSGIQFDFAYMRKPLVYLHHKDIPQHYEEGTFHYDTMAFGEICHDNDELIHTLIEYMQNDCKMKPEYVKRADDFFYYRDHNNCERIYKEMIDYQEKYVLPERY